jgi:hypothetical protein
MHRSSRLPNAKLTTSLIVPVALAPACLRPPLSRRKQGFESLGSANKINHFRNFPRRGMAESDPMLPSAIQSSCVAVFLFDQLVRAQQDRCRHIDTKRLGGRHIEHGLRST